jgi:hypothetical protein
METSRVLLIVGAVGSGLISLLHVVLALRPELWRYVAPGGTSALREMAIQGSTGTIVAAAALAVMFAVWALYGLSGAGAIGRLPLLRTGLIGIGVIFLLRGLFIVPETRMVLAEGYAVRFALFSAISLLAGLLYVVGALGLRQPPAA